MVSSRQKYKNYWERSQNLEDLEDKSRYEINRIPPGLLDNATNEFLNRLAHCQIVNK